MSFARRLLPCLALCCGLNITNPSCALAAQKSPVTHPVIAPRRSTPHQPAHGQYRNYPHGRSGGFGGRAQSGAFPLGVRQLPGMRESTHLPAVVHQLPGSYSPGERSVVGLRNGRIANPHFYHDVSRYHAEHYHVALVERYARYPNLYNGYWSGGWYHGYWRSYWIDEPWVVFDGYYGFWIAVAGVSTFVYESAPDVCSYWNGETWVAWYSPPYTPYYCPY